MARRALSPSQLAVVQAVRPCFDGPERGLVIGCSGGADSLALVAACANVDASRVLAVVVEHGLQADSLRIADAAVEAVRGLGVAAEVRSVHVDTTSGEGVEAAARRERLVALVGDGKRPVLLGHTLDDQAETVLLGLARGSGAASLQAMAPSTPHLSGRLVRPLLGLRRSQVRQACLDWGLMPWDDPMNLDPAYLRVRVRHELLPVLDDVLGPGVVEALGRTATLARHDNDLLERLAADAQRDLVRGDSLDAVGLLHLYPALRGRVLRRWMIERGAQAPTMAHVQGVAALVENWHGQVGVDLPGGVRVHRIQGALVARSGDPE